MAGAAAGDGPAYEDALAWLYGRQRLGVQLGLEKVDRLLARLGDPQHAYNVVHVAGTNGKGSVTRMLAQALRNAGHRVGLTTSPHLVAFTERIETDRPITRQEVADGLARIRPHVEALDAEGAHCTFFEVVTALAFVHFRDRGVEWAVVETGMGGRLDATNVVRPRLTIITNVDLDHQQALGGTVGEIAWEKSGIMKPGVPCVTAARGEALLVLKARSHELSVPMSIVGEDYRVVPDERLHRLILLRPNGESHYDVGLAGAHQLENAAVTLAAVEALRAQGVPVPERALRQALALTRHPGRLELFRVPVTAAGDTGDGQEAEVLVDGAHNPAAARAVASHLRASGWSGIDLVCGFCRDKDWPEVLATWAPFVDRVWAVPIRNGRSLPPAHAVEAARALGLHAAERAGVAQALEAAVAAGADRILVAGSLFLAGEARAHLTGVGVEEIRGSQ
ncbi:MAG TPA: folylpolyglutamate synthase/dihydrofolate synthase family protein [Candidatus Thermoplasmatota archaeon]|nr:folylpolyglutamate synthase/dihydrofolate synthase family protein [Candidatus Thermoplasmatota archaeon]